MADKITIDVLTLDSVQCAAWEMEKKTPSSVNERKQPQQQQEARQRDPTRGRARTALPPCSFYCLNDFFYHAIE